MGVNWLVSLCVSLTILALWTVCQKLQRSWIGPGGLMCGVWFFASLTPLFFSADFPTYASAYLVVLAFVVVCVIFTSLPIAALYPADRDRTESPEPGLQASHCLGSAAELRLLHRGYWVSLAIGSTTPALLLKLAINQFGTMNLLELANKVTMARYTGDFKQPVLVSILTMFLYLATLMGGLLMGLLPDNARRSLKYMAWVLPLLFVTVIQTTKASTLYGVVLFGGALITGIAMRRGETKIRIGKLILTLVGLSALAFGFILLGLIQRYSNSGGDPFEHLPRATVYCVGHMAVLGNWTESGGIGRAHGAGGIYTFGGIFEMVGHHNRIAGVYDDDVNFRSGGFSNIYTAFRACIDDFTLPGALVFFAILSFIGGLGWVGVVRGNRAAVLPLTAYLSYILWSPITSIFLYNTIIGALALFGLLMAGTWLVSLVPAPRMRIVQDAV